MKILRRFSLLASLFWVLAVTVTCTTTESKRQPSSTLDLIIGIENAKTTIQSTDTFNEDTCESILSGYVAQIDGHGADFFFPKDEYETEDLRQNVQKTMKNLFDIRNIIRERHADFTDPSPLCTKYVRRVIRYSRVIEDYLADYSVLKKWYTPTATSLFAGTFPETQRFGAFANGEFLPGDVILLRADNFISATVARSLDEDSNFSHVGMIVKNPTTGALEFLDAAGDTGVTFWSIEKFFKINNVRAVLFRHKNREVAENAAAWASSHFRTQLAQAKDNTIFYDFKMDHKEHTYIFCSELIMLAYNNGNPGRIDLPKFYTSFVEIEKNGFAKTLDLAHDKTFAPNDIELEKNFEILAEYRSLRILNSKDDGYYRGLSNLESSRIQDAVMTKIFQLMDEKKYKLKYNGLGTRIIGGLATFGRKRLGMFSSKVQSNITSKKVEVVLRLGSLSDSLEEHLAKTELAFIKQHGRQMSFHELLAELEIFRKQDCETHITAEEFRPSGSGGREARKPTQPRPPQSEFHKHFKPSGNARACRD